MPVVPADHVPQELLRHVVLRQQVRLDDELKVLWRGEQDWRAARDTRIVEQHRRVAHLLAHLVRHVLDGGRVRQVALVKLHAAARRRLPLELADIHDDDLGAFVAAQKLLRDGGADAAAAAGDEHNLAVKIPRRVLDPVVGALVREPAAERPRRREQGDGPRRAAQARVAGREAQKLGDSLVAQKLREEVGSPTREERLEGEAERDGKRGAVVDDVADGSGDGVNVEALAVGKHGCGG